MRDDITFNLAHTTARACRVAEGLITQFDLHRDPASQITISPLLHGIDLRFEDDLPLRTWGFTLDMGPKIVIAVNARLTSAQTRFTALHEIGHIALWHPDQVHAYIADPAEYSLMEAEATTVAALILVPGIAGTGHVLPMVERLATHYDVPPSLILIRRAIYHAFAV